MMRGWIFAAVIASFGTLTGLVGGLGFVPSLAAQPRPDPCTAPQTRQDQQICNLKRQAEQAVRPRPQALPARGVLREMRIGMSVEEAQAALARAVAPYRAALRKEEWGMTLMVHDKPAGDPYWTFSECVATHREGVSNKTLRQFPNGYNCSGAYIWSARLITARIDKGRVSSITFHKGYLLGQIGYGMKAANITISSFAEQLGQRLGVNMKYSKGTELGPPPGPIAYANGPKFSVNNWELWEAEHELCNCVIRVRNSMEMQLGPRPGKVQF